jgi:RHS repeat-associated protein
MIIPSPLTILIYQAISKSFRTFLPFFLFLLVSTNLFAQQCYVSISPNPVQFPLSGDALWVDVNVVSSCPQGLGLSIWDIPSWASAYVSGNSIYISVASTGSYRTGSIGIRSNGITVNSITIKQGTPPPPPPPPPCVASGFGGNVYEEPLGETRTYPISFSNCGGTSAGTFTFQTSTGGPVPSWLSVSQNGNSIIVTSTPNNTPNHRTVVILATTSMPAGNVTVGGQISQASCLKTWYLDADNDGYAVSTLSACTSPGSGYSLTVKPLGDCNDSNATVYPGAMDICDGLDNNCNGSVDENTPGTATGADVPRCGPGTVTLTASGGSGNTVRWYSAATGGTLLATSTSYTTPSLSSTTTYYAESYHSDTQCAAPSRKAIKAVVNAMPSWYADSDGDGFGNPSVSVQACSVPAGYVSNSSDYDDGTVHITNIAPQYFYADVDGDGFGDPANFVYYSVMPVGYVLDNTDGCPTEAGPYNGCNYVPTVPSNENYIYTRSFQREMDSVSEIYRDSDVIESITYFDGLGRPMQSIGIRASRDTMDIVTHVGYDAFGRQDKDWLPYKESSGSLGSYRGDRSLATKQYYQTHYAADFMGVVNAPDIVAYSQKGFEASPLNRVLLQAAPGEAWKLGSGHEIGFGYLSNTNLEVVRFNVNVTTSVVMGVNVFDPALVQNGTYGVGELYKTVVTDENGNTSEEFKDKQGRVVLKRNYGDSDINMDGDSSDAGEANAAHDTYYVYDDYGNLTYVIPPKVDVSNGVSSTELSELCYQYKYDARNRLVEKKLPGKGWEYIVYDKLDRAVLTQDQNLFGLHHYIITGYDAFNRVAFTGKMGGFFTRLELQAMIDMIPVPNAKMSGTSTIVAGVPVYYDTDGQDTSGIWEALTINYYDTYVDLPSGLVSIDTTYYGQGFSSKTKGLPTVSKVKVLDSSTLSYITTVTYYDDKGRVIYVYVDNPYLGTVDIVENKLDFTGKVLESKTTHKKTGKNDIVTLDHYTYDHMGRLLTHKNKINTLAEETIASNTYDDLGQLITKGVGNVASSGSRLQTVNYTYNVRGWLKGINNESGSNSAITLGSGDLFGFQVNYNAPGPGGTALFNGNISQTLWKTTSVNNTTNPVANKYSYTYDALNRITNALDDTPNLNFSLNSVIYDKNGNITFLERKGHTIINGSGVVTEYGVMDKLDYNYYTDSNRLQNVQELAGGHAVHGFKDGSTATTEYTYDVNGNMVKDLNKGIVGASSANGILYNHLNLPEEVKFGSTNKIKYIYDANGVKLRKQVVQGGQADKFTYYAGNHVYEGSSLKFFSHGEGYVEPVNPDNYSSGFGYVYQYKDHLGNVRLSYKNIGTASSPNLEIHEENNYYPFGLQHKGYNTTINSTNLALKRKFGGKELQDELGLDWYDVTARNYDPAIGRWMNLDPLAEQMRRHSPYNYAFDNPVYFIDPDGMMPFGGGNPISWVKNKVSQAKTVVSAGVTVLRKVNSTVEYVSNTISNVKEATIDFFSNINSPYGETGSRTSRGGAAITSENGRQGDQQQLDKGAADIDQAPIEAFDGMKGYASLKTNQNQKTGGDGMTNATTGSIKSMKNTVSELKSEATMFNSALKDGKTLEKYYKALKGSISSGNTGEVSAASSATARTWITVDGKPHNFVISTFGSVEEAKQYSTYTMQKGTTVNETKVDSVTIDF